MKFTETKANVDLKYLPKVAALRWQTTKRGYLCCYEHDARLGKVVNKFSLHAFVWGLEYGTKTIPPQIDHIDGDKLNNRISNLRAASPVLNSHNKKSKRETPGVAKRGDVYTSIINYRGKKKYLGSFATPEEATAKYMQVKEAIIKHEAELGISGGEPLDLTPFKTKETVPNG